jgi:hypothetical protein
VALYTICFANIVALLVHVVACEYCCGKNTNVGRGKGVRATLAFFGFDVLFDTFAHEKDDPMMKADALWKAYSHHMVIALLCAFVNLDLRSSGELPAHACSHSSACG